jgi:hypothetical protein
MFLIGLGTATPLQRYTQRECWEALRASDHFPNLNPRSRAILKKVLGGNNGIRTRFLALVNLSEAFSETPDALHARFTKYAPTVAAPAGERALMRNGP